MSQKQSDIDEMQNLEKIAAEYVQPDPGRLVDKKNIAMIADRVMPLIKGPEVLEMGFGDDEWTSRIVKQFGHSNIIDAAKILLDIPKEKYGDAVTTYHSLFETFVPDKQFDSIIASFVLEHVEDPVAVLRDTLKWLKDDGKMIVIVPHADSLHRRLAVSMGMQQKPSDLGGTDIRMGHRRVYDLAALERDVVAAGYKIESKKGFLVKLIPQSLMANFSDELLKGLMDLGDNMPIEYTASIGFICTKA